MEGLSMIAIFTEIFALLGFALPLFVPLYIEIKTGNHLRAVLIGWGILFTYMLISSFVYNNFGPNVFAALVFGWVPSLVSTIVGFIIRKWCRA
jgi:hypothetical protein